MNLPRTLVCIHQSTQPGRYCLSMLRDTLFVYHTKRTLPVLFVHQCYSRLPSPMRSRIFCTFYNQFELVANSHFLGQPTQSADTWLSTWDLFPTTSWLYFMEEVNNSLSLRWWKLMYKVLLHSCVAASHWNLPHASTQKILNNLFQIYKSKYQHHDIPRSDQNLQKRNGKYYHIITKCRLICLIWLVGKTIRCLTAMHINVGRLRSTASERAVSCESWYVFRQRISVRNWGNKGCPTYPIIPPLLTSWNVTRKIHK